MPVVRSIVPGTGGRILLLRRASSQYAPGGWCLPGGKVDYGETVEQAVRDELREETGFECVEARFLFYQDGLPGAPGSMHCVNFYFECSVSGTLKLNPESVEWAWVPPNRLERYDVVFRNDEGLRRYWDSR